MNEKLATEDTTPKALSREEILQLLTYYIKEVIARRRYARAHVCPSIGNNGRFIEFYDGTFDVADYTFRICDNKLSVQKCCKTIGECDTNTELIGWLFQLLGFIIDQCHVKELRAHISYDL